MQVVKHRLQALDWMRGLVMILMCSDHASAAFNADKPRTDSALLYDPTQSLDTIQFLFRWLSHLCAPTFLFLAGTSLALSIGRKLERGASSRSIDKDLLVRGLVILGVDLLFVNLFWFQGGLLLQVMYAIGISMLLMIPLRRLPARALVLVALAVLAVTELFLPATLAVPGDMPNALRSFLISPGRFETGLGLGSLSNTLVSYPALPWWSIMALGWAFGGYLFRRQQATEPGISPARLMGLTGSAALGFFILVRVFEGYGDAGLSKLDGSLVQWLHVSKYPPSLSFVALELGLMACLLALFFRLQELGKGGRSSLNPLLVFGQTAFFFYIAHILFLELGARSLGVRGQLNLGAAIGACLLVTAILYPLCIAYRHYKGAHPSGWLRYF